MQKLLQLDPLALIAAAALLVAMKFGAIPVLDTETILIIAMAAAGGRTFLENAKKRDFAALQAAYEQLRQEASVMAKQLEPAPEAEAPADAPEG